MTLVAPLAGLSVIALVLWVVATALAIALVMQYIGDAIRAVPVAGPYIAGAVDKLAQAITSAAGKLESGIDHLIGAAWHTFARYLDFMWHQFEAQAATAWHVANALVPLSRWVHRIEALTSHALHGITSALPRIKTLEHEYHGIEHQVKTIEHELSKGIGEDVLPRLHSLERELHSLRSKVIPAVQGLAGEAESEAQQALKDVEAIPFPASAKTWAEAIAIALPALGLDWLRCNSNPFKGNKNACGLWGDLSQLLGVAFIAAEVASLDELIGIAQTVTEDVTKGVEELLKV